MNNYDYIHDGSEIYRHSFAIIRREANLTAFSSEEEKIVVRMIHACGMVDLVNDIVMSPDFVHNAKSALKKNATILCDANMVAHGVTRARLPANNPVICTLKDEETAKIAKKIGNTRSAAALDLWGSQLEGALVAIGNAPTALFRLLEMLHGGVPKPAAIIGMPVGFVGAAESKEALAEYGEIPFIIVKGRKGGSAMAAAVVNALASEIE
jgi:precorrin-8X/cobalt-precorrin-8 methylmutase